MLGERIHGAVPFGDELFPQSFKLSFRHVNL